jgi:hypothetical protein
MLRIGNKELIFLFRFVESYQNAKAFVPVVEPVPVDRLSDWRNVLRVFIGKDVCHPRHCAFKEFLCGRLHDGFALYTV